MSASLSIQLVMRGRARRGALRRPTSYLARSLRLLQSSARFPSRPRWRAAPSWASLRSHSAIFPAAPGCRGRVRRVAGLPSGRGLSR